MNTVRVAYLNPLPTGRVLVTSDVHGHLRHLQAVLEQAGFGGDDLLILVGDLTEKGPDSLATLRFVGDLVEQGRAISAWGNVDYLRVHAMEDLKRDPSTAEKFLAYLRWMRDWKGTSLFDEMCRELGEAPDTAEDILKILPAVEDRFAPELDFLRAQPTVIETPRYRFVHGGLKRERLSENLSCHPWELLKLDDFPATARRAGMRMEKYTVVGHWPVSINDLPHADCNPITDHETRIISIDGGCGLKREGQLNLLVLPSIDAPPEAVTHLYYDDLPTKKVLRDQAASEATVYIRYGDAAVRILRLCGDSVRGVAEVEHISTARRLWVPLDYLYDSPPPDQLQPGDTATCEDVSDYRLPLRAGETVSVICETAEGTYAKKNGVSGWIDGE